MNMTAGRIFLPMLLVMIPAMGMWGIWWTTCLTWVISALFCTLRYAAWYRRKAKPRMTDPKHPE